MKQTLLDKKIQLIWHEVVENTLHHVVIENRIENAIAEFLFKLLNEWIPVRIDGKSIEVPMRNELLKRVNELLKASTDEKELDKKLAYFQKQEDKNKITEMLCYLRAKRDVAEEKTLRSVYNEAIKGLDVLKAKIK